ncbi:MAG: Fic family protein [Sutterellaceae bacterium]|nr:Fic family protein [Sutterellaceae bacterium]
MDNSRIELPQAQQFADKPSALLAVDGLLAQLNALTPITPPAVARLTEELKLETTYDSNAIEGSKLSLRDTVAVVKDGWIGQGARVRDVFAAQGFAYGYDAMFECLNENRPVNEDLILQFHRYVMLGARPEYCGAWRDHEVRVLGADFRPAHHTDVPKKVAELVSWYRQETILHPIEKAARFHAEFETIHPFPDGNGRTGRLLLNYMLLQAGLWPINIRYHEDRADYYAALGAFRIKGHADDLTVLIAQREAAQLAYCIKIALEQEAARQSRE